MSIILRDTRIQEVEEDVDYLKSLIDGAVIGLETRTTALEINDAAQDITLGNHENRITTLEG
jgi:hypothetical protein